MSEVLNVIEKRSSIRKYKEEPLTPEIIEKLVKAGLQAPTANNEQEVHISVVHGEHPILAEIEEEKRKTLIAALEDQQAVDNIKSNPDNFYYNAPIVFFLSVDKSLQWSQLDAGIAVENISLAAQSLGLGNLIIGIIKKPLSGEKADYFAKVLQFPENYEFAIAIAVGYKDTEKAPHEYDVKKSVSYIS